MTEIKAIDLIQPLGDWKRTHNCGELTAEDIGKEVCLMGWVQYRRDHGGLIFIDLRDRDGLTQVVFSPDHNEEAHRQAHVLRSEYVLAIKGKVRRRPEGMENPKLITGEIEVVVYEWKLLNISKTPPFLIEDRIEVSENLRLKYRYLDLRRKKLAKNIILRHKAIQSVRRFLNEKGFLEVETPFLSKSTPEGARDFLVPSRLNQGEFFALPQSPQLFKQLLMVSGFDKYYQIVKCFRDEDLRADRQPEFTQIDMEMSFVSEEDVMDISEEMIARLFKEVLSIEVNRPFERLSYDDAIDKYGTDKPDVRFELPLVDITDIVKGSDFRVFSQARMVKALKVSGGSVLSRKEIDDFTEFVRKFGAQGLAWIKIKEKEWQSPIAKFLSEDEKKQIANRLNIEVGDIIFFQAGEPAMVNTTLGNLRVKLGARFNLIPEDKYSFVWVTDFPMFEWNPEERRWNCCHHPFTSPKTEFLDILEKEPENIKARAYDLVLNGHEIGGGSIRIHSGHLQRRIFKILELTEEEIINKFGFLLEALEFGAPPHGGIAFGFDRILMLMAKTGSIREVIPFPKTQKGTCLLTGAPSTVSFEQLAELGIRIKKKEEDR